MREPEGPNSQYQFVSRPSGDALVNANDSSIKRSLWATIVQTFILFLLKLRTTPLQCLDQTQRGWLQSCNGLIYQLLVYVSYVGGYPDVGTHPQRQQAGVIPGLLPPVRLS